LRAVLLPSCVVLAGVATVSAARADCAPAAANNVTATCSGITTNQEGGAPGTSAGTAGYGTGVETGVTVNVVAGAGNRVTGTLYGISLGDGIVSNNVGASITGGAVGIFASSGFANVTNSGSITGTSSYGIYANTGATVTNNAGASITGGTVGINAHSFANVTNSGSITGTIFYGIIAFTNATVINNAGASITGGRSGIVANSGFANVTNSGSILGTSEAGIFGRTNATVTNNAGASVTGGPQGIYARDGFANVTNFGSIIGDYGIFVLTSGGSSVFNAGSISGGTAAIQFAGVGNTLTLAPGSAISGNVLGTGSDTFQLGGTGAATFDVSQLGAAAQYQGFGTFNKIGGSAWTLTGTSTFAGPINVNAGTLAVNGNVTSASGVTVNAGGTLAGTGTVGNTLVNGGTLSPGNSIGTLTVSGSLTLTAASTYMVQVSGASADKTIVTGTATLAGKVTVDMLSRLSATTTYTFINAGSVSGTFSTVDFLTANNFARNARLSYSGNSVLLTLDPGLLSPILPGTTNGNQKNVAAGIDNALVIGTPMPAGFNALFALSGNPLLNALTQASGETATGSQQTTFNAMTQFMGMMTDPFLAGRDGGTMPGSGATPFADADDNASAYAARGHKRMASERDTYAMFTKAPLASTYDPRWSVWAAGFGGSQSTDGNAALGSNNTTSRVFGVAAGADYRFSPNTLAGFALAGGGTNFAVNGFGSGRSDLFQAGAFVRHNAGPAYITAAVAYGWQDITTDRTVTIAGVDQLRARFNANAWSGRVEGGYRFVTPWFGGIGITPYAAGQFTTFELPAYAEGVVSGANTFALAYGAKSVTAPRSEIGVRSDKSFAMQNALLTLRGRLAWAYDYNTDRSIGATFQTLPGASFVVGGAAQSHNKALTTASAEVKWINGWSAAATFEGEFSDVSRSYAGKGVVRYQW
jgi:uncharacterized protein with beta-barrel porin domain